MYLHLQQKKFIHQILTIKISTDKIRDVIGKGGAVIKGLAADTGAIIDIDDDGLVKITCTTAESGEDALSRIKEITADVEVDQIYDGKVIKILDFGAIVSLLPGKDGLLHISQIAQERVAKVTDYLTEGQDVRVKVTEIDNRGRVKLSIKEAQIEEGTVPEKAPAPAADVAPETAPESEPEA